MKNKLILVLSLISAAAFAEETPKCLSQVGKPALARINRMDGWRGAADTRAIYGIKPLFIGAFNETYLIAVSDEVEPSEWIAVVNSGTCKIQFLDVANDGTVSAEFDY